MVVSWWDIFSARQLGFQIGTDSLSQVLKEFWPDVKRKLFKGKKPAS